MGKRRYVAVAALAAVALLLTGCQEQFQDLDTQFYSDPGEIRQQYPVLVTNPESVTIYRNADGFPNVAIVCVDGVPFSATSSTHQGGLRQVLDIGGVDVARLCPGPMPDRGDQPIGGPDAGER